VENTRAAAYVSTFLHAAIMMNPMTHRKSIIEMPCGLLHMSVIFARGSFDTPPMMLANTAEVAVNEWRAKLLVTNGFSARITTSFIEVAKQMSHILLTSTQSVIITIVMAPGWRLNTWRRRPRGPLYPRNW
jgi:hypothetical protein